MKRFSVLETVYNDLIAIDFDFDSLPANNKYRKYAEWKRDPELRSLPAGSAQDTGQRRPAGIRPFGRAFDDANKYFVGMSGRTSTALSSLGGNELYGIESEALDGYIKRTGFVPAKAHLAVRLSNSVAVPGSQNRITGQPYKKSTGESYTIPFGRKNNAVGPFDRQDEILANRTETHVVTFTPEKLSRR